MIAPLSLLLTPLLQAPAPAPAPAPEGTAGPVAARAATGPVLVLEALDGTVRRLGPGAGTIRDLASAGAAFVRFENVPRPAPSAALDPDERASVELAGGDRLSAAVRGGDGDLLRVALEGGVELDLSVDALRSVVFPARIPDTVTESPAPGDDGDRLYLRAGSSLDRATGFVEAFGEGVLTFSDARLGARDYEWSRVVALFITPFEEDAPPTDEEAEGARVSVSLVGGGRLSGQLVEILGPLAGVRLRIGGTSEVTLPGALVREVALDDGSFAFLGDLERAAGGDVSLFGDEVGYRWPVRVDRNCKGGPLRVGGVLFDRGLGVHAPSRLTWNLEGQGWTELRLASGVDDSGRSTSDSAVRGNVRFRVLGDGEVLWESAVHRAGTPALRPEPIALAGVKTLVLEADPAGDFVLDRADWLRPLLVK